MFGFPLPDRGAILLRRTSLARFSVPFAVFLVVHLLHPDRIAQHAQVERPGPVRMVHVHRGYLPRLLRPGPRLRSRGALPLNCGLFARLFRGVAAGLTRRRDGRRGVGFVGSSSSSGLFRLRDGLCGTQSRHKMSRLSESALPRRRQRQYKSKWDVLCFDCSG